MEFRSITTDNLEEYGDRLDADAAENIGRDCFRGLSLHKGKKDPAEALLVWEVKNLEEEADCEAELACFYAEQEKSGDALLAELNGHLAEDGVVRSFFEFPSDLKSADKCMKKAGFSVEKKESRDLVVSVGELAALDIVKRTAPAFVAPIGSLMVRQFRKGIANCMFHGRKGLVEDLATLPMSWYDEDVSCCVQADEKVNGFLLVHKTASGKLLVELLCAIGPDFRMDILYMMRYSVQAAAKKYPKDTPVILRRHSEAVKALTARLFPKKSGEKVLAGTREEGR
ncbi:MAG: hypothetical protein K6E50_11815 [Lachnospiraceae bacterium]|nr:hypothetical protein [Lachnospiraceae bacterium]